MKYFHKIESPTHFVSRKAIFLTNQGGEIAIDKQLYSLWLYADNRSFEDIVRKFSEENIHPDVIKAGLVCLVEAELLIRTDYQGKDETQPRRLHEDTKSVSVVVVNYNSKDWLRACFESIYQQTCRVDEIILVDNGSQDGSAEWVERNFSEVKILPLKKPHSLAYAINQGVIISKGEIILLLNPDIAMDKDALNEMVDVMQNDPQCGAVAPKLKFMWAPGFLNGIGNFAGAFFYGMDIGLGHLDFGQFDTLQEVPSASFAGILIDRKAWNKVGEVDEEYPLYYEDLDWSYRARMLSFRIRTAPQAVIFHAMGRRNHRLGVDDLTPQKIRNVTFGRNRFALKIFPPFTALWLLVTYLLHDLIQALLFLYQLKWHEIVDLVSGDLRFINAIPKIIRQRRSVQRVRKFSIRQLLKINKDMPRPRIWWGVPILTWKDVTKISEYLRELKGNNRVPEFENEI